MATEFPDVRRVHKGQPLDSAADANQPCIVCGWEVSKVPGGNGPVWIHTVTQTVGAPTPPVLRATIRTRASLIGLIEKGQSW